jgi:hypothetical protein
MIKTVFVLNVDNYAPEITELTYPLIRYYADKIGAGFYEIKERKFPDWPVTYEKMQIYELAKELKSEWNIYIDSDALIHPETIDWTCFLDKDTVAHNANDMASVRWKYNEYFMRDGRNIGSCNWFTVASDWCLDLWKPLEISLGEAMKNIRPTVNEYNTIITPEHLIDDYTLSNNIARFGLKYKSLTKLQEEIGLNDAYFHWHVYTISNEEKVKRMKQTLEEWKIPEFIKNYGNDRNNRHSDDVVGSN